MACTASIGRLEPCNDQVGGLKNIYFVDHTDGLLTSATFDANDQITAFSSALTLYKYELRGEVHSYDEQGTPSADNGTYYVEQSGSVVLKTKNLATRKELQVLGKAFPHIIVEDYNGNYRISGIENGCTVSVQSVSGAAKGDLSGYNVSWTAMEKEMAYFISSAIIGDTTNTSVTVGT